MEVGEKEDNERRKIRKRDRNCYWEVGIGTKFDFFGGGKKTERNVDVF